MVFRYFLVQGEKNREREREKKRKKKKTTLLDSSINAHILLEMNSDGSFQV